MTTELPANAIRCQQCGGTEMGLSETVEISEKRSTKLNPTSRFLKIRVFKFKCQQCGAENPVTVYPSVT
jgi:ribosomal protein L40E